MPYTTMLELSCDNNLASLFVVLTAEHVNIFTRIFQILEQLLQHTCVGHRHWRIEHHHT